MTVDHKIIEDCKRGRRRAQNKLYTKYARLMLGVCLRYSKDLAEAEDILQEGFIKVFSNISKLKDNGAIEAWIRRIMINTAISQVSKKKVYFDPIDESLPYDETEQEDLYLPVDPDALMEMVQNLPEGYRMVLNLYVFEGFTHKQIAQLLGIRETTSKTQLFKARKYLRKQLESKKLFTQNTVNNETIV